MQSDLATTEEPKMVDREAVLRALDAACAEMGIVYESGASAEHARQLMLLDGVRPEERLGSSLIIADREGNG